MAAGDIASAKPSGPGGSSPALPVAVVLLALAVLGAASALPQALRPTRAAAPSPVLPEMMDEKTVKAIERGMIYLATTQKNNGVWLNSGGYGFYPVVMTSLGGLALMAGGSTPQSGPYCREVTRAMNYVLNVAEAQDDGAQNTR